MRQGAVMCSVWGRLKDWAQCARSPNIASSPTMNRRRSARPGTGMGEGMLRELHYWGCLKSQGAIPLTPVYAWS